MLTYNISYMETSIFLIEEDISLFPDKIKNQVTVVKDSIIDYRKNKAIIQKARNLGRSNKQIEKELTDNAVITFNTLFLKLKRKYTADIKDVYIGDNTISKITVDIPTINKFCTGFLQLQEARNKNELTDCVNDVKKVKEDTDNYLSSKSELKLDKKSKIITLNESDSLLEEKFNLLKSLIHTESLENKKLIFRLYFPPLKTKKKSFQKTVIQEMSFNIFLHISQLPNEFKTDKIYNEWLIKLNELYLKEKLNEYQCFIDSDNFIVKKYKIS